MIARVLIALLFTSFSCIASYAGDHARMAKAVQSGLLWETRWYGHTFGQRCLQRAMNRGGTIQGLIKSVERTVGFSCSSGAARTEVVQSFEATVRGSGILLSGEVKPTLRAEIADGEDNPDCSLTEDDLIARTRKLEAGARSIPVRPLTIGVEIQPSPALKSFAARTVAFWARKENLVEPRSLYLGPVASNDPFLVVGAGDRVLLIRFPSEDQVASQDFCGVVFSPHRFAGRQAAGSLGSDELAPLIRRLAKVGQRVR